MAILELALYIAKELLQPSFSEVQCMLAGHCKIN